LNSNITDCDMLRNVDMTALRSFVTVADTGGVTKAAGYLNLTQSAVSMQLKRLEGLFGQALFARVGRGLKLTHAGEQLLSYGHQMISLNDEVVARLTEQTHSGTLYLGVPDDIVYPHIPRVLQRFAAEFPRVNVQLVSSYTTTLLQQYDRGQLDITLATEEGVRKGGSTLTSQTLMWVGAEDGTAWKARPLRLAFENNCLFRSSVHDALDGAEIPWEPGVNSNSTRTIEASVSADLCVHACLSGSEPPHMVPIDHGGTLPMLPSVNINLYVARGGDTALINLLGDLIKRAYGS
jgi:DNA-binding transcriptional LysR family regulator